ncbi:uncharacterized protein [Choristoneura fumiferana]|uniref:uncharacterized protein n=1 Tax=Choristoneura fumiferana TaxID=7141 RepID=UPI003D155DA4
MARLLINAVVAIAAIQYAAASALECSKANEESRCVAECPPEKTCRNRGIAVSCLQSATENYKYACVCKPGFFRNDAGECVTDEECDNLVCSNPNEEKRCVAQCPPQKTCRTRDIQVSCLESATKNCKDTCVCKDGFYKNVAGECVSSDDCDKCFGQNQYYSCRTQPDKLCTDFKKTDSDSTSAAADASSDTGSTAVSADTSDADDAADAASPTSTQCKAQCYCAPGTARDENNQCVPYDQCNQPCDADETKDYCPADCPSDYCPKTEPKSESCPTPNPCPKPQCKCRINNRRAENGKCIPTRDCPKFECKKPFEEANMCPPLCPNGSCGQATPTGRCPAIFGRIGILLICNPQCRCKEGYWWDENKVCVPYNQCPGKGDQTTSTSTTSNPVTDCSKE